MRIMKNKREIKEKLDECCSEYRRKDGQINA